MSDINQRGDEADQPGAAVSTARRLEGERTGPAPHPGGQVAEAEAARAHQDQPTPTPTPTMTPDPDDRVAPAAATAGRPTAGGAAAGGTVAGGAATAGAGAGAPAWNDLMNGMVDVRSRWSAIQAGFVDEPRRSVEEAHHLLTEVVDHLARSLEAQSKQLESQWSAAGHDVGTEDLRLALQRYRGFLQTLLRVDTPA